MSTSIKVTVIGLVDVILDLYYCALLYCTLTKPVLFYSRYIRNTKLEEKDLSWEDFQL